MNKEKFIEELEKITGLDNSKCTVINSILENHFLIGNKNKEKMVSEIENQLSITHEESEKIYESAMSILAKGLKDKIKHPFRSQGE